MENIYLMEGANVLECLLVTVESRTLVSYQYGIISFKKRCQESTVKQEIH